MAAIETEFWESTLPEAAVSKRLWMGNPIIK